MFNQKSTTIYKDPATLQTNPEKRYKAPGLDARGVPSLGHGLEQRSCPGPFLCESWAISAKTQARGLVESNEATLVAPRLRHRVIINWGREAAWLTNIGRGTYEF